MRVYPQNLGIKWHIAVLRHRAQDKEKKNAVPAAALLDNDQAPSRRWRMGRLWARGSDLEPAQAERALPAVLGKTLGGMYAGIAVGGACAAAILRSILTLSFDIHLGGPEFLALWTGLSSAGLLAIPRAHFLGLHRRPLSAQEIEMLLPAVRDELERAYLILVIDAVRQQVSPEAEPEVRNALRALGTALDSLPSASVVPENAQTLRDEAAHLQAQARTETDDVVCASLERQAESLLRLADVAAHSSQLVRRAAALRAELATQTRALHAGLTTFRTGNPAVDAAGLTHLADSVQTVAAEAVSVAAAREELDTFAGVTPKEQPEALPLTVKQG